MKVSKRDIKLLLILGGLLSFLLLYFCVFTPFQEKTDTVKQEIATMEPQLAEMELHYKKLATYEQGVKEARSGIDDELKRYPTKIENEDFLSYLMDWEKKIGFNIDSVAFDEPGLLNQFSCVVDQNGEDLTTQVSAYRTGVTAAGEITYPQMKEAIDYFYASLENTALDSVSVSFNAETGLLTGSFGISKYYIGWQDAPYAPKPLPYVSKGVADPFGTT